MMAYSYAMQFLLYLPTDCETSCVARYRHTYLSPNFTSQNFELIEPNVSTTMQLSSSVVNTKQRLLLATDCCVSCITIALNEFCTGQIAVCHYLLVVDLLCYCDCEDLFE